jgi:hypothetical protein
MRKQVKDLCIGEEIKVSELSGRVEDIKAVAATESSEPILHLITLAGCQYSLSVSSYQEIEVISA